jgi:NAD-dependent dihydropyrimidine dehydrogenase PreA subunit
MKKDISKPYIEGFIGVLPIVILLCGVFVPREFADFLQTVLGKLISVSIIVLYTSIDVRMGIFVSLCVVFIYEDAWIDNSLKEEEKRHLENLTPTYPDEEFRRENCRGEQLIYKDMTVKGDIADHIFPVLKYPDEFHKCNPCSPTCSFSIIESKLERENGLSSSSSHSHSQ